MTQGESEREYFNITREARAAAAAHTGPTAERYDTAFERYLAAIAHEEEHLPRHEGLAHSDLYWNIHNNLVSDVMTRSVYTVSDHTPFKEIVSTLVRHHISAVPVVDAENHVLGMVSESDLLAKVVAGGDPRVHVKGGHATREVRRKSHAETAGELMHAPAITTRPDVSIVQAARTAALAHTRRLPVVDHSGVLVGIVTRSDLLRVFRRGDAEIREHLIEHVLANQPFLDASAVELTVRDGVVRLTGEVERRALIAPLVEAIRSTAGVVGVHDDIAYRIDDDTFMPPPKTPLY